jgi:hypothetical protein
MVQTFAAQVRLPTLSRCRHQSLRLSLVHQSRPPTCTLPVHRGRGLGLVGRRLFEPLRQLLVVRSYSAHPFPSTRVLERRSFDQDFLGAVSRIPR